MSSDSALDPRPALDGSSTGDRGHDLRIAGPARGSAATFSFDGRAIPAFEGESVACALFAAGIRTLRRSPREGQARGMFCLMGSCQECVVWVDGRRVAACQEPVHEGLVIRSGTIACAP